jgi:DNA replication licensing factor MCM5
MDRESVYALSIGLSRGSQADEPDSRVNIEQRLVEFILEFQIDNAFIYRYALEELIRYGSR